jgi:hypothetical protein
MLLVLFFFVFLGFFDVDLFALSLLHSRVLPSLICHPEFFLLVFLCLGFPSAV